MGHHHAARLVLLLALFQWHLTTASARPAWAARNVTGDEDSSGSHLHCERTTWYDVCWFFFTNYLLHALSVRSLPGENAYSSTAFKLCCLLVPYTGVRRGLSLISRASSLNPNDLQAAARAGALCMVVRKQDWRPEDGQTVHGCQIDDDRKNGGPQGTGFDERKESVRMSVVEKSSSPSTGCDDKPPRQSEIWLKLKDADTPPPPSGILEWLTCMLVRTDRFNNDNPSSSPVDHENIKIHGLFKLAPGYGLSYVPPNVKVYPRHSHQIVEGDHIPNIGPEQAIGKTRLASTHDIPRILFSLIQTVSGGYSLYKARGSQIDRYGYAAFGLTVLPYVIVSIINFLGSFLSAEYETIYMVHSNTMDEMVGRGGMADGVVGSLHGTLQAAREISWSSEYNAMSPDCTNMRFTNTHDRMYAYDVSNDTRHSFAVLPYEARKPPPKRKCIRLWNRIGQWHGWATSADLKPEPSPSGPAIILPTHAPIDRLPQPSYQSSLNVLAIFILFLTLALPYVVIGFLTGWKANQSTSTQRSFVLTWLICGQVQGYAVSKVETLTGKKTSIRGMFFMFVSYGSNCLCGLVIVAQEMLEFGTCKAM